METIPYTWKWWIILAFGIIPYSPLVVGFTKDPNDESHSALTWSLYLALDCFTLFSGGQIRIHLDPMVLGFAIGSLISASVLFYQRRYANIGLIELIMLILIAYCFFNLRKGYLNAFETGVFSELLTGIYLIWQTWNHPKVKYNFQAYSLFLLVSIISLISTERWKEEEYLFAVVEVSLNIIILIPLSMEWIKERKLDHTPSK